MRMRTVPLGLLALLLALPALAQESVVTATTWVDDWTGHHKGKVLLRKINGRWWTDDNREVYAPGKKECFGKSIPSRTPVSFTTTGPSI